VTPERDRSRFAAWALWSAFAFVAVGGLSALLLPAAADNRIAQMALPYGLAAAALAVNALAGRRRRELAIVLYVVVALAVVYGMAVGLAVPLRLDVQGRCDPALALCPVGFARPLTGRELLALDVAGICGLLALLLTFLALELQLQPRLRPLRPRRLPSNSATAESPHAVSDVPAERPAEMPLETPATKGV
jgi:hypothetical protein